jgi:hypothetical protein
MENGRIRRNDRVWFNEDNTKKQGLVLETHKATMTIVMDGFGGKMTYIAREEDGKWFAAGWRGGYILEVFKT